MTYRKKLMEVALPLDDINAESARERSINHHCRRRFAVEGGSGTRDTGLTKL